MKKTLQIQSVGQTVRGYRARCLVCATGFMLYLFMVATGVAAEIATFEECLSQKMMAAADDVTIGELRRQCSQVQVKSKQIPIAIEEEPEHHVVEERMEQDRENVLEPFTLMAHKPNYLLFFAYNDKGYDPTHFRTQFSDDSINFDDYEAQFQLSVKFPLLVSLFDDKMDIYAAYTNRSFWQVYNKDISSPFRETNHEPEIWVQFHPGWDIFGFINTWNSFGFNHQSNGQGGVLSRSWNRLFAWITFERGNLAMSFKPWYRIQEDIEDDDNPDITDYLGHFELSASYLWDEHVFSIMSRNNLESGFERGAVELSWSFPLGEWPYVKGYVQYFNGYGESLIDYDRRSHRIGVGVILTDWLAAEKE